jgi:uncharacterized alpha-E superfamily protein
VLARVAENVYWLARYLERAENTARLVSVNTNLLLDLPKGLTPGWQPLIDITGNRAMFDARGSRADERDIVQFLLADPENPGSIGSSFKMARENARSLRDIFPTESWELLNQFFLEFIEELPTGLNKRTRFNFLKRIVLTSQTITGSLEGTMNRNDAYTFLMLGRNVERADMTSRIVDVRSAQLLPEDAPELRPFDTIQWMSVLRSLSGYEMYRLSRRTRVSRTDVLEFVLRGEQFPRACGFCLRQIEQCLLALPRSAGVLDALAGVIRFLSEAELASLDQPGLHQLIDRLQLHIIGVHDGIAQTYFPSRGGATTMRQVQWSDNLKTLPLFADAPPG